MHYNLPLASNGLPIILLWPITSQLSANVNGARSHQTIVFLYYLWSLSDDKALISGAEQTSIIVGLYYSRSQTLLLVNNGQETCFVSKCMQRILSIIIIIIQESFV